MDSYTLRCCCHSPEHQVILSYIREPWKKWMYELHLYFSFHLCPDTFFKRVVNATRYIFGHRSRYGDFDEMVLDIHEVKRLMRFLQQFLNDIDEERVNG